MATFLAFRIPKRFHHQVQPNETWVSRASSFQQLFNRLAESVSDDCQGDRDD